MKIKVTRSATSSRTWIGTVVLAGTVATVGCATEPAGNSGDATNRTTAALTAGAEPMLDEAMMYGGVATPEPILDEAMMYGGVATPEPILDEAVMYGGVAMPEPAVDPMTSMAALSTVDAYALTPELMGILPPLVAAAPVPVDMQLRAPAPAPKAPPAENHCSVVDWWLQQKWKDRYENDPLTLAKIRVDHPLGGITNARRDEIVKECKDKYTDDARFRCIYNALFVTLGAPNNNCWEFMLAMGPILDAMGIENKYITGDGHAFNAVRVKVRTAHHCYRVDASNNLWIPTDCKKLGWEGTAAPLRHAPGSYSKVTCPAPAIQGLSTDMDALKKECAAACPSGRSATHAALDPNDRTFKTALCYCACSACEPPPGQKIEPQKVEVPCPAYPMDLGYLCKATCPAHMTVQARSFPRGTPAQNVCECICDNR